jgi:hypothetical protein
VKKDGALEEGVGGRYSSSISQLPRPASIKPLSLSNASGPSLCYLRKLAIDLGSTFTRLAIFCPDHRQLWPIENPENRDNTGFQREDFPSGVYVFDDDGVPYTFGAPLGNRESTSAKFLFYLFARKRKIELGDTDDLTIEEMDELLAQYPLVDPILRHEDDQAFVARARNALHEMFVALGQRVKLVCAKRRIEIEEIGLTIPSQWDLNFEDVYREIVAGALETIFPYIRPSHIEFVYETEALAHLVFNDYMEQLVPPQRHDRLLVLFLDLGGHGLVCCFLFSIQPSLTVMNPFGNRTAACKTSSTGKPSQATATPLVCHRIFHKSKFFSPRTAGLHFRRQHLTITV